MAIFDVFVKGIDPERKKEKEQIKLNLGEMFNLQGAKLDALIEGSDGGVCIRRRASEQEAKKFQSTLAKMGMICICKPVKVKVKLSLVPIETQSKHQKLMCPVCKFINYPDADGELEQCQKCGLQFEKYEQLNQDNLEKSLLKERIIKKEQLRQTNQRQQLHAELKKEEQQRLQKEIESELGISATPLSQIKALTPLNKAMLGIFLVSGISIIGGSIYVFTRPGKIDEPQFSLRPPNSVAPSIKATHVEQTNLLPSIEAHQRVTNFLPENISAHSVTPSSQSINQIADESYNKIPIEEIENIDVLRNNQQKIAIMEKTPLLLQNIIAYQAHDNQWITLVNKPFDRLLSEGHLYKAFQLSNFQSNLTAQIDMLGRVLLEYKKQGNTRLVNTFVAGIVKKINRYSGVQQAKFYAQLGKYQYQINASVELFDQAYQLSLQNDNTLDTIKILGSIAAYQAQAGLDTRSHSVFKLAQNQTLGLKPVIIQVISMAELAKNYIDANDINSANEMLIQAETTLKHIKKGTSKDLALKALSASYAYLGDAQKSLILANQITVSETRADALFNNIIAGLNRNETMQLVAALAELPFVSYQGTANAILANHLFNNAKEQAFSKELLILASEQVKTMTTPETKSLAASSVARSFYQAKQHKLSEQYYEVAINQADLISEINLKDRVLSVIAIDQARSLLLKQAREVLEKINLPAVRILLQKEINNAQKLKEYLNAS